MNAKQQQLYDLAFEMGYQDIIDSITKEIGSHPQKNRSFHYLPYHTDSGFEQTFMKEVLALPEMQNLGLELYYNGDRAMTEFKIKCYRQHGNRWDYIGVYTPDFLLIQRKDGKIYKAIIIETKGAGFEKSFEEKKAFVETEFLSHNNTHFGYTRFEYLYLPDTISEKDRIRKVSSAICSFFAEVHE